MASYNKIDSTYDKENKRLIMHRPTTDFLPSYVYSMCEKAEKVEQGTIETIVFSDGKEYKKESLRGRYDWSDVK